MTSFLYPKIHPPTFTWTEPQNRIEKVHEWIKPITNKIDPIECKKAEIIILGVPLSRSSISSSGASEFPEAFRRSWRYFNTYNLEDDIDLSTMMAFDAGDVPMHVTDISKCHHNIFQASKSLHSHFQTSIITAIGGDHSITAMMVKGMNQVNPLKKVGILQFDTHFDLRDLSEDGPSNGTPMRNLIESGIVYGENMYNVGLHGFFNSKNLKNFADEKGVNYLTLRQMRKDGMKKTVRRCLEELSAKVDVIYLTVDMDALDIACAPGVPASTPGGMTTEELLDGVLEAGKHPLVRAMDLVCLDPLRDSHVQQTVKLGTLVFLTFLAGVALRKKQDKK
ncbi:MAG: agmatinase family protein [Bacillota bacterium]|nr:agmatinase family protein [Bacillota bacterium]MDP4157513.1 agmatinase family protein [Bacillota bacterium]